MTALLSSPDASGGPGSNSGSCPTLREDQELAIAPEDYSLVTDLYQLTMSACYLGGRVRSTMGQF